MLAEFKKFIMRGNVLDLAVGIIIGLAFGAVVNSLVNDILMPPIGMILGNVDFSNLYINLTDTDYASLAEAQEAGAATINYGLFINAIINFLIVALAVFLLVRAVNRMMEFNRRKVEAGEEPPVEPPVEERLIESINRLTEVMEKKAS